MDRSDIIQLPATTYSTDEIGQKVATTVWTDRFCAVESVTQTEFFAAGQNGLKAEYKITIFNGDYAGEEKLKYNSVVYSIYRTYRRKDDLVELYVQKDVGS